MREALLVGQDQILNGRVRASVRIQWPAARIVEVSSVAKIGPAFGAGSFDVVILDSGLPDLQPGQIRGIGAGGPPVIVLVADDELGEKGHAWVGADDYIVKPFSPLELIARIDVACDVARSGAANRAVDPCRAAELLMPGQPRTFDDGVLSLDFTGRRARIRQRPIFLTATEFDILAQLIRSRGFVVSNRRLLAWAQGNASIDPTEYLSIHMRRLRRTIEPNPAHPRYIVAERGIGYKFNRPAAPARAGSSSPSSPRS